MDLVLTSYDEKLKPLFDAVESGNLEVVRKWISDGEPLLNPKSRTPSVLAVAAEAGFFSMLELLLASGDWRLYPKALNAALHESVNLSHVDNSKLLLDNGAEPGAVGWYSIFATHKRDLVTAFLEHGKDTADIGEGIEEAEWGTARALRDWLEHDKSPEQPLLLEMISALDDYYSNDTWYRNRTDFKPREENERAAKHADRILSLIRWTGVDTRRKVSTEERVDDSVFAATVRKGTRNQLRALGQEPGDIAILNAAALDMDWCDKTKFDYMVKCGLVINDRDDGTSTLLLQQFKNGNQTVLKLLADQDARLPEVEEKDLIEWNRRFYRYSKPAPGILLSLAKILTEDQFSVVVDNPKAVEVFGATPREDPIMGRFCQKSDCQERGVERRSVFALANV